MYLFHLKMKIYFTFVNKAEMNQHSSTKYILEWRLRMYYMRIWKYINETAEIVPENYLIHAEVNIFKSRINVQ